MDSQASRLANHHHLTPHPLTEIAQEGVETKQQRHQENLTLPQPSTKNDGPTWLELDHP